ncbi:hypothetical protein F5Y18DRAFT_417183 [Xylariaceae sp. FL1019]|nr:hypothetical protein F5Y18DRAFT_417183 [Xylariaceae sp. FL1019]
MASSQNTTDYPVHLGVWTNWSRGPAFGQTMTLKRREGDLLIAFTALFVAWVSTRGWRIISFIFHRLRASHLPQNAAYHQCQAILRNSDTQTSIVLLASLLWTSLRHHSAKLRTKQTILGPLSIFVIAVVYTFAFTVAGGFSSQISTAVGTEVLIESQNCGWDGDEYDLAENLFLVSALRAAEVETAANYAQQCYSDDSIGVLDCNRLAVKNTAVQTNTQAECPFRGQDICRNNDTNIRIDSGYIDSHEQYGVNTPPDVRILVRMVLHCAPMQTQGFTSYKVTDVGNLTLYHYGNITLSDGLQDYMFTARSVESHSLIYKVKNRTIDGGFSDFIPIQPLFRDDAHVMVAFLSGNGVVHTKSSDDKWYRVSRSDISGISSDASQSTDIHLYLPLEPASPMGCTQQWQFCSGNKQNCGPLESFVDAASDARDLFDFSGDLNTQVEQNNTKADYFNYVRITLLKAQQVPEILLNLGPRSLTSQKSRIGSYQGFIPSNQWQLDVSHWFDIFMASYQLAFAKAAYFNPTDKSLLKYRKPFPGQGANLCNNQKIRSTAYSSFSLFGLLFTFIVGFFIITVSFILEPVFSFLYKAFDHNRYATQEWNANTTLQLQRLAHEGVGFGTWSKGADRIPVTESDELLACLNLQTPDHPKGVSEEDNKEPHILRFGHKPS